jgi:exoribonuclease R
MVPQVIWEMTPTGEIVDTWFGRTIIRSSAQLAYEDAQEFIDGTYVPKEDDNAERIELMERIKQSILTLDRLAKRMRKRRFEQGSLSLDSPKLSFTLDIDQNPIGVRAYERKDSHMMVEEWMLLANTSVGHKIVSHFPNNSLVRRHDVPNAVCLSLSVSVSLSLSLSLSVCVCVCVCVII